jgi:hypothetical protein
MPWRSCHRSWWPLDFVSIVSGYRVSPTAAASATGRIRLFGILSFVSMLLVSATAIALPSRPASADQISDLKTQAAAVSQKLVLDQLQIDAYQQRYSFATAKVAADARAIALAGRKIDHDDRWIRQATAAVRQDAIQSYMHGATALSGSASFFFTGDIRTEPLAKEYDSIAAGNIDTALDRLHIARDSLHAHQATLQDEQSQDQADQKRQATYLAQAVNTEHQMETVQSQVTGQLAAAITQQAAAQAAAAAAAVTAARRAAATKAAQEAAAAATGSTTTVAPPDGSVATSDPQLNPFLQCVVQVESGGNYQDVSPNGLYMGAFQFSQPTWNLAAQAAGLPSLVGVPPNRASKADQDTVAVALYALDGEQPWLGDRCA